MTSVYIRSPQSQRAGYLTPVFYQNGADGRPVGASACKDITKGNNSSAAIGGYSAQQGYDAVTGWGSPIGTKLLDALAGDRLTNSQSEESGRKPGDENRKGHARSPLAGDRNFKMNAI